MLPPSSSHVVPILNHQTRTLIQDWDVGRTGLQQGKSLPPQLLILQSASMWEVIGFAPKRRKRIEMCHAFAFPFSGGSGLPLWGCLCQGAMTNTVVTLEDIQGVWEGHTIRASQDKENNMEASSLCCFHHPDSLRQLWGGAYMAELGAVKDFWVCIPLAMPLLYHTVAHDSSTKSPQNWHKINC